MSSYSAPRKAIPGRLPHATEHAVAADHPAGRHLLRRTFPSDLDPRAVLRHRQAGDFPRSHDLAAERLQARQQEGFGAVLRAHEREGVFARDFAEVDGDQRRVVFADAEDRHLEAFLQELGYDAQGFQHLQRPRMDNHGAGGVRALGDLIDGQGLEPAAA